MTIFLSKPLGLSAVLAVSIALAGCTSSGFVDEGAEDEGLERNLVKGLMTSMGAIDPKEKPIEYKPRAPLVAPPKRDLPPPQDSNRLLTTGNFPRNPEDVDRERAKAAAKEELDANRAWTPEELARYRMQGGGRPTARTEDPGRRLSVEEMRGQGASTREAIALAQNPGPRRSLTEPPTDYLKPSDKAPVEMPEEKSSWKPSWWPL